MPPLLTILLITSCIRLGKTMKSFRRLNHESDGPVLSEDSDDHSDAEYNETRTTCSASVICKRKRFPPAERRSRPSSTASMQSSKDTTSSVKQRKLAHPRDRPLLNYPSAPQPLPAAQYSGCDTKIRNSDDSNDDCSEGSGDFGSNKRPLSNARTDRPRRHTQKRNHSSADEDDEYEVEGTLEARINRKRLQYRAKWLDLRTIQNGTMRATSRIARTDSVTFTRTILPNQGLQKGCDSGHNVGRRTETPKTALTITWPRAHTREA